MNLFKSLDTLFPVGKNRTFGEVVSVRIEFHFGGTVIGSLNWKRKAWYVDASVNAFHMHRGLVREFLEQQAPEIPKKYHNAVKRLMALAVLNGYLINRIMNIQHTDYAIRVPSSQTYPDNKTTLNWSNVAETGDATWREIEDSPTDLRKQIWRKVDNARNVMHNLDRIGM